ncbi:hypothetical protein, partial [Planktothrix sp. FACHB-1355]|uniref:hypothetical protein n=1 Tax=Planktothrix sp. FACHB-1355 TaxID=2692854 RepID=UPI001A7EFB9C
QKYRSTEARGLGIAEWEMPTGALQILNSRFEIEFHLKSEVCNFKLSWELLRQPRHGKARSPTHLVSFQPLYDPLYDRA